jgi:hypothetical protein
VKLPVGEMIFGFSEAEMQAGAYRKRYDLLQRFECFATEDVQNRPTAFLSVC